MKYIMFLMVVLSVTAHIIFWSITFCLISVWAFIFRVKKSSKKKQSNPRWTEDYVYMWMNILECDTVFLCSDGSIFRLEQEAAEHCVWITKSGYSASYKKYNRPK